MKTIGWITIIAALSSVILYQQSQKPPLVPIEAKPAKTEPVKVVRMVTASEEFRLRGECVKLAGKMSWMVSANGRALTSEMLSHYNPETNRCYVEFIVTK